MEGTKNWWESTTIRGAIIQLIVLSSVMLKLGLDDDTVTAWVTAIFGTIGLTMVIYGRIKAKYVIK